MKPEVLAFIKAFLTRKGITSGLTQEQHCAILVGLIGELVMTEATTEEKIEMYALLYPLINGSALRQKLESDACGNLLEKKEGGSRGSNADAMAAKWAKEL